MRTSSTSRGLLQEQYCRSHAVSRPLTTSALRYHAHSLRHTRAHARALAARPAVGPTQILQTVDQEQQRGLRPEATSSRSPPHSSSALQLVRAPTNLTTALATLQQAGCLAVDLYKKVASPMAQALTSSSSSSSSSSSLAAAAAAAAAGSSSSSLAAAAAAAAAGSSSSSLASGAVAGSVCVVDGHVASSMDPVRTSPPSAATATATPGLADDSSSSSSSSSFTDSSSSSNGASIRPLPPDLAFVQYVPALPSAVDYGASKAQGPRPWQEDRCVACSLPVLGPGSSLVAVFDGHGGQAAAEAAAARVPDLLGQHLVQGEVAGFHRAFHAFDRWLIDQITSGVLHWDRSGCTAVAGVCCGDKLLVGHVGDSAALLVDMEGGVTRLTENHNTFNEAEVERVRASGALVEFSRGCPVPRVWDRPPHLGGRGSMVTRALGDLDFKRAARGITNEPAVLRHTLRPGADLALVTVSDGVTDVLSDADIGRLVVRCVRKNRQGRSLSRSAADMGLGFLVASEVVVGAVVARSRDNMAAAAMVFNWV